MLTGGGGGGCGKYKYGSSTYCKSNVGFQFAHQKFYTVWPEIGLQGHRILFVNENARSLAGCYIPLSEEEEEETVLTDLRAHVSSEFHCLPGCDTMHLVRQEFVATFQWQS
jgi:hypothetical protein